MAVNNLWTRLWEYRRMRIKENQSNNLFRHNNSIHTRYSHSVIIRSNSGGRQVSYSKLWNQRSIPAFHSEKAETLFRNPAVYPFVSQNHTIPHFTSFDNRFCFCCNGVTCLGKQQYRSQRLCLYSYS